MLSSNGIKLAHRQYYIFFDFNNVKKHLCFLGYNTKKRRKIHKIFKKEIVKAIEKQIKGLNNE